MVAADSTIWFLAFQVVKAAEAQADAAQLQGEGIARQRRAIIDGLRRRPIFGKVVDQSLGFAGDLYEIYILDLYLGFIPGNYMLDLCGFLKKLEVSPT